LDTSYTNYEFFIGFGNKIPTEYKYDANFQSNKATILPADDSDYNQLYILIKSYKHKKVAATVAFSCKNYSFDQDDFGIIFCANYRSEISSKQTKTLKICGI